MHTNLNIPLEANTTRQRSWRVVWISFLILFALLTSWTIFRYILFLDTLSSLRPEGTSYSFAFHLSPNSAKILSETLSERQAFSGDPWSYGDFVRQSQKNVVFHFSTTDELIGISLDQKLPIDMIDVLNKRGFSVTNFGKRTLVHVEMTPAIAPTFSLDPHSVLPSYSGSFLKYHEGNKTSSFFTVKKNAIVIHQENPIKERSVSFNAPAESTYLAHFVQEGHQTPLPSVISSLPLNPHLINLFQSFTEQKSETTIFEDRLGIGFIFSLSNNDLDLDSLTSIAYELISPNSLSTTDMTLEDGSMVQEIRTQRGAITSQISTDNGTIIIQLKHESGAVIIVHKDIDGLLTISNRTLTQDSLQPTSSCVPESNLFIRQGEILTRLVQSNPLPTSSKPFHLLFSEISFKKHRTFLCW